MPLCIWHMHFPFVAVSATPHRQIFVYLTKGKSVFPKKSEKKFCLLV